MLKVQLNTISGFEEVRDVYQVCRDGNRCWVEGERGKVINGSFDKYGYRQIGLILNSGKQKTFLQHRIFMICFIPNPENKSQVNHKDGNKQNNLLSNLVWNTSSENRQHAYDTGLAKANPLFGEHHGRAKLRDSEIPIIFQMRKTGITLKEIGLHFGVSGQHISLILSGKKRSKFFPS